MNAMTRPTILPHPAMIATAPARRWYVLSVEPNRDIQALRYLRRKSFDARCLKIEVRKSRRSPDRVVQLMFPGYLFIEMEDGDSRWHEVIGKEATLHNHVHCALGSMLTPTPLPEIVVDRLWAMAGRRFDTNGFGLIDMAGPDGQWGPNYPKDTPIRVCADGPFIGLSGRFVSRRPHNRVAALLMLFNRELTVELDERDIEPIDGAA